MVLRLLSAKAGGGNRLARNILIHLGSSGEERERVRFRDYLTQRRKGAKKEKERLTQRHKDGGARHGRREEPREAHFDKVACGDGPTP